jgi:predicted dehydrogenase
MARKTVKIAEETVTVLLSAISGYGLYYLQTMLASYTGVRLVSVVDPTPEKSSLFPRVQAMGVPVFPDMETGLAEGEPADLAVISSPIHYHVDQACRALQAGSHVLLDKPMATTVQEADRLIRTEAEHPGWVMVGYQWCYSDAVQALKQDLLKGLFGKPLRMKTLCLWPRTPEYYQRNDWAGAIKDRNGRWVLDSPLSNAMAHFLHNMLYLLGDEVNGSAEPLSLTAEVYRANDIENYDTAACRIETREGYDLWFYGSHAIKVHAGPVFSLECEEAVITLNGPSGVITAKRPGGSQKAYGHPDETPQFRKLFDALQLVRGEGKVVCGPAACRAHTVCMNGVQETTGAIPVFPAGLIREEKNGLRRVEGLSGMLIQCYDEWKLPSETGCEWSVQGKSINLRNYNYFPSGEKTEGEA